MIISAFLFISTIISFDEPSRYISPNLIKLVNKEDNNVHLSYMKTH